ncbi:hypothetical protein K491DRAFT_250523 [Lophiostoma macrostomum CBS 122681]|uniref:Uncharacterized protein n=1 Tax=Lophiostoma macrostomum CBS 122681 TaxID=1314788 RepID=A0A6A6SQB0_9PLEO|nr:hypothetical protein K491DRAFT_250523 [Lophiostoma macrostomum CBS 122681]
MLLGRGWREGTCPREACAPLLALLQQCFVTQGLLRTGVPDTMQVWRKDTSLAWFVVAGSRRKLCKTRALRSTGS